MGQLHPPQSVLPLLAAFSRHSAALDWARARAEAAWGPVVLASEPFAFEETAYYEPTMGAGLRKIFFVFAASADPDFLIRRKRESNAWELEFAGTGDFAEPRPLNLDPGYLAAGKLVLASTKDHAHRIYLGDGIYAEVTLQYRQGVWRPFDWTFPDYRRADYHDFFTIARERLREAQRGKG